MTITAEWDNPEQTIIRVEVSSVWKWEEIPIVQNQCRTMMNTVLHPVSIIVDVSNSHTLPNNALSNLRKSVSHNAPNLDLMVVVGANLIVRSILQMFQKLSQREQNNFSFAPTLETARTLLAERIHETHVETI